MLSIFLLSFYPPMTHHYASLSGSGSEGMGHWPDVSRLLLHWAKKIIIISHDFPWCWQKYPKMPANDFRGLVSFNQNPHFNTIITWSYFWRASCLFPSITCTSLYFTIFYFNYHFIAKLLGFTRTFPNLSQSLFSGRGLLSAESNKN